MKKLITAIMLLSLLTGLILPAYGGSVMDAKGFVEQVMAPAAGRTADERFAADELKSLLKRAGEQGYLVPEDLMPLFSQPDTAYKEELMRALLKEQLGFFPDTWSIADQAWYDGLLVEAGLRKTPRFIVPLPGDVALEQALDIARQAVKDRWDEADDLMNPALWRLHANFSPVVLNPQTKHRQWVFWFEPLAAGRATYHLTIRHDGQVLEARNEPGASAQGLTPGEVQDRYTLAHGAMITWTPTTWDAFQRDLAQAVESALPGDIQGNIRLLLEQEYGTPTDDMLTAQQAIDIAAQLPQAPPALNEQFTGAVLLMDGDIPVWKARLIPLVDPSASRAMPFLVEVDARDGTVRNHRQTEAETYQYRLDYVLETLASKAGNSPIERNPAPAASPRPDGKPWFWYADQAPQHYWQTLDCLLAEGDIGALVTGWEQTYGQDEGFWPLEAQALRALWGAENPLEGTFPGLPEAGDITRDQALEIARQALMEAGTAAEALDGLTPLYRFEYNNGFSSARHWVIDFARLGDGWAQRITVIIINALTGEVISIDANG